MPPVPVGINLRTFFASDFCIPARVAQYRSRAIHCLIHKEECAIFPHGKSAMWSFLTAPNIENFPGLSRLRGDGFLFFLAWAGQGARGSGWRCWQLLYQA